jgi:hypothetical protein
MYELILGFILAAIFIASYLLIAKLFKEERGEIQGKNMSVHLNPANSDRAIGAGNMGVGLLPEHTEKKENT